MDLERRSLIASTDINENLGPDSWLGFECSRDEAGGYYWKMLICRESGENSVIITQRHTVKIIRTLTHLVDFWTEIYPNADRLEVPLRGGDIYPKTNPRYWGEE